MTYEVRVVLPSLAPVVPARAFADRNVDCFLETENYLYAMWGRKAARPDTFDEN